MLIKNRKCDIKWYRKIVIRGNKKWTNGQKLDNEGEKDVVTKEIISVTSVIEKVRKEIKLCDEVADNAPKMKEHIRQVKEKEQEEGQKRKTRIYEL